MSNRFHNKFHRQNHHSKRTAKNNSYIDAGYDPIASFEVPFQGEFFSEGDILTTENLSAQKGLFSENASIKNNAQIQGSLNVIGNTSLNSNLTVQQNLSVAGNSTIDGNLILSGNLTVLGSAVELDTTVVAGSALSITNNGTGPALTVTQYGSEPIARFIDINGDDIIFQDNGYVGLGTNNPSEKLTVVGNISSSGSTTIGTLSTGTTNDVITKNSNNTLETRQANVRIWDTSANFLSGALSQNYVPKFDSNSSLTDSTIYNIGSNVGINTSTPNQALTVVGSISSTGSSYVDQNQFVNANLTVNQNISSSGTVTIGTISSDVTNNVIIKDLNNTLKTREANQRIWDTSANLLSGNLTQNILPKFDSNSSLINSIIYDNGTYVGINTISPTDTLTVQGSSKFFGNVTVFGDLTATGSSTFANTVFSTTSALSVVHIGSGTAAWIGNNGTGDIASFYDIDAGVEILHVGGNNGTNPNVGVKTGTPNVDFTVNGDISASKSLFISGSAAIGTLTNGTTNTVIVHDSNRVLQTRNINSRVWDTSANFLSGSLTQNYLVKFESGNTVTNSNIYSDGTNIGVGTSNPNKEFTVVGQISSTSGLYSLNGTFTEQITSNGAVFLNNLNLSNNRILNVLNPISAQDAVTKNYVDTLSGTLQTNINFVQSTLNSSITSVSAYSETQFLDVNTKLNNVFTTVQSKSSTEWDNQLANQYANNNFLPLSGGTVFGRLSAGADSNSAKLNIGGPIATSSPSSVASGDLWINNGSKLSWGAGASVYQAAAVNQTNTFSWPQTINYNTGTSLTVNNTGTGGASVFTAQSSAAAVRVTQTGSGNAIVVEDSTNPDATPFVVDALGSVGIGLSSLSGIDAKLTVIGNISSTSIIYASGGNSDQWSSSYSTVQTNSATTWNYQGTDLKALSGNWQDTFTTVATNSSQWAYSTTTPISGVYYVAKNGSNSYAGTATQPFSSIQYAINQIPAGTTDYTIYIAPGVYVENLTINRINVQIVGMSSDTEQAKACEIIGNISITASVPAGSEVNNLIVFNNVLLRNSTGLNYVVSSTGSGYSLLVKNSVIYQGNSGYGAVNIAHGTNATRASFYNSIIQATGISKNALDFSSGTIRKIDQCQIDALGSGGLSINVTSNNAWIVSVTFTTFYTTGKTISLATNNQSTSNLCVFENCTIQGIPQSSTTGIISLGGGTQAAFSFSRCNLTNLSTSSSSDFPYFEFNTAAILVTINNIFASIRAAAVNFTPFYATTTISPNAVLKYLGNIFVSNKATGINTVLIPTVGLNGWAIVEKLVTEPGDPVIDTGVRALTANWQNTFSSVQSTSANWNSVFSTVQSNSSTNWNNSLVQQYVQSSFLPLSGGSLFGPISSNNTFSIETSSNNDCFRITQTGSGNALIVEDESNPDSTPFVITNTGRVGIGTTTPVSKFSLVHDDVNAFRISNNESLEYYASFGVTLSAGYFTAGSGLVRDVPLIFRTSFQGAEEEKVRFTADGKVGINTSNPNHTLTVTGSISSTDTVYAKQLELSSVTFTNEVFTNATSITASNDFLKVVVGGNIKYLRLYDVE